MNNPIRIPALCLLLAACLVARAAETDAAAAARALHRKLADAVVNVRATVSITVTPGDQPAQSQDRTFELVGTVVSADGRVLLAASSIDPAAMMDGRTVNTPAGALKLSAVSQVKEAFIVLADGTEIPAKVVLNDKDLNLAMIAPSAPGAAPFVAVDTAVTAKVEPVDEVVVLGRMDKSFNRCAKVEVDAVAAVVAKPRPLISIHVPTPGCPVFNAEGKFVGITSFKLEGPGEDIGGDMKVGMETVVIPAESVQKFIAQAQAKPAAK